MTAVKYDLEGERLADRMIWRAAMLRRAGNVIEAERIETWAGLLRFMLGYKI